jgi:hypothetical protein
MTYPVVKTEKALTFYAEHDADACPAIDAYVESRPSPVPEVVDVASALAPLAQHAVDWRAEIRGGSISSGERNRFEASMAGPFHRALSQLPVVILDDPDFWRYLGLGPLRWFTLACDLTYRNDEATLPASSMESAAPMTLREHPVMRTYLRGQMTQDPDVPDDYSAALWMGAGAEASKGRAFADIDVLKSHLIRRLVGETPAVARAFLKEASNPYLPAGNPHEGTGVRSFIKYFGRARPRTLWEIYSGTEACAFGAELRETFDGSPGPT